jgi:transposase
LVLLKPDPGIGGTRQSQEFIAGCTLHGLAESAPDILLNRQEYLRRARSNEDAAQCRGQFVVGCQSCWGLPRTAIDPSPATRGGKAGNALLSVPGCIVVDAENAEARKELYLAFVESPIIWPKHLRTALRRTQEPPPSLASPRRRDSARPLCRYRRRRAGSLGAWGTIYRWFAVWRDDGRLERINHALVMADRKRVGRDASPSAAIIDSQSVKTTEAGGSRGYDAGKKINGRKRHALVDADGRGLVLGCLEDIGIFRSLRWISAGSRADPTALGLG